MRLSYLLFWFQRETSHLKLRFFLSAWIRPLHPNINLTGNLTTQFTIVERTIEVQWEEITEPFVYSRTLVQHPQAIPHTTIRQDGSKFEFSFIVSGGQSIAGRYTARADPRVGGDISVNLFVTESQFKDYEILPRTLTPRLRSNALTINSINFLTEDEEIDTEKVENYLVAQVAYDGFASDDEGSDDESVLDGRPKIRLSRMDDDESINAQRSLRTLERLAVIQISERFLTAIEVDDITADNYLLQRNEIPINITSRFLALEAHIENSNKNTIPQAGDILTASIPGTGIENAGLLSYEWFVDNRRVTINNRIASYFVMPQDVNKTIRVEISSELARGIAVAEISAKAVSINGIENNDNRYGIRFAVNPVSEKAEISVVLPASTASTGSATAATKVSVVIYDMTGNVVFERRGVLNTPVIEWDLRNQAGRTVANGTYLVVVEAKDRSGKTHRYSARLGVKK